MKHHSNNILDGVGKSLDPMRMFGTNSKKVFSGAYHDAKQLTVDATHFVSNTTSSLLQPTTLIVIGVVAVAVIIMKMRQ